MELEGALFANVAFFLGWLFAVVTEAVAPVFINMLGGQQTQIWTWGLMLLWLIGFIVVPLGIYIKSITGIDSKVPKFFRTIGAISFSILTLVLAYFGWFMVDAMVGLLQNTVQIVMFWIGISIIMAMNILVTPIYTVLTDN